MVRAREGDRVWVGLWNGLIAVDETRGCGFGARVVLWAALKVLLVGGDVSDFRQVEVEAGVRQ